MEHFQKHVVDCKCTKEFLAAPLWMKVFIAIGTLVVTSVALRLLGFIWKNFIAGGKNLRSFGAGKGAYAVVTGATDGIGKEYAISLARKGFNVLLISRTAEKLQETAAEIKTAAPNAEVRTLALDLGKVGDDFPQKLKSLNLDIGVLVNNVGMSYDMPTPFHELSLEFLRNLINLNCRAAVEVTHAVIPYMLAKKRGLIINISSASSLFPTPLLSAYSGSKAFINMWSQGLNAELASQGVYVEAQAPHYVVSKLSKIRRASISVPSARSYVSTALSKLGHSPLCSPWTVHQIENFLLSLLPYSTGVSIVHNALKDVRRRALKRAETKKE